MANSLRFTGVQVQIIPTQTEGRPVYVYADGKRTDQPRLSASGRPLLRWSAVLVLEDGTEVEGKVLSPVQPVDVDGFRFGRTLLAAKGDLTVRSQRDQFDLAVGFETEQVALLK
jgi:hypothetical protein